MKKHLITKIYITLYPRRSFKSGRIWWSVKPKEKILKNLKFIKKILLLKEVLVYDEDGKIYKKAKKWKVKAISLILSKPLKMSHEEEFEKIYKPIDKFFLKNSFPIYNMWGSAPKKMSWQMDGRHISWDKE